MLAAFGSRSTNPGAIISVFLLRMLPAPALAWRPPRFHVVETTARASASSSAGQEPMGGATEASSSSRAIFLDNDGEWIDTSSIGTAGSTSNDIELLDAMSVPELRQEAQLAGQKSTGSKKELVQRLLNQEPPSEDRGYLHDSSCVVRYREIADFRRGP